MESLEKQSETMTTTNVAFPTRGLPYMTKLQPFDFREWFDACFTYLEMTRISTRASTHLNAFLNILAQQIFDLLFPSVLDESNSFEDPNDNSSQSDHVTDEPLPKRLKASELPGSSFIRNLVQTINDHYGTSWDSFGYYGAQYIDKKLQSGECFFVPDPLHNYLRKKYWSLQLQDSIQAERRISHVARVVALFLEFLALEILETAKFASQDYLTRKPSIPVHFFSYVIKGDTDIRKFAPIFDSIEADCDLSDYCSFPDVNEIAFQKTARAILHDIPIDLYALILSHFDDVRQLIDKRLVCKYWNNLIVRKESLHNNLIWKNLLRNSLIASDLYPFCNTQVLSKKKLDDFVPDSSWYKEYLKRASMSNTYEELNNPTSSPTDDSPAARITLLESVSDEPLELTMSKIGGDPSMDPNDTWTEDMESFVAQINLADLRPFYACHGGYLPISGLLLIFHGQSTQLRYYPESKFHMLRPVQPSFDTEEIKEQRVEFQESHTLTPKIAEMFTELEGNKFCLFNLNDRLQTSPLSLDNLLKLQ